ncbi:hypothetical protein LEN26_021270 [Aphanomyces euteiches]|nr:hypothetical protein LEN26_021270 [Aphanomyces euteiches]KAH9105463.1 hypothetical protein AeMF1_018728 [Aphanomyces euteiches]KAH9183047.1 hypothetical protein AeNC1_014979 [Aphanomyces euteiches]
MDAAESHFNLLHSRTRMAVECAFGLWKNTFRIFQVDLLHGTPDDMILLIEATLVIHNWFIDEKCAEVDVPAEDEYEEWMHIGGDLVYDYERNLVDGVEALLVRNQGKTYLYNNVAAN